MKRTMIRGAALALALALTAAACGDDDDTADSTASSETTEAPAGGGSDDGAGGDETGAAAGAAAIPEHVGPADDSLEPVVIGMINLEGGQLSYPDVRIGAEAAAKLINEELGGIQGHPVELRVCAVGVDQASNQACAQEFANAGDVNVVLQGYSFGSAFSHPVFEAAGLPVLMQTPLTSADFEAPLAWAFQGGNIGGTTGTAGYAAKYLDAEKVVVLGVDLDATRGVVAAMEALPSMQGRDLQVTYLADTATDLTADVQVSGAAEADAVLVLVNAHHCIQIAQTLRDLGVTAPVLAVSTCATQTTLTEAPELFEGWHLVGSNLPPLLADGESVELDYFREQFAVYGEDDSYLTSFQTLGGFGSLLALREIGNDLPATMSRADWAAGIEGFTGPYFGGKAEVACPGKHYSAICDNDVRVYVLDDQGVATEVQGFFDALS